MHLQQGYKHEIFLDDVIKWKHFPRYWPFVWGIHRSPVNSPHKGQWRGALMFTLICARINGWVNNREAGDLRRYPAHCDVIVMCWKVRFTTQCRINETQPSQCNHDKTEQTVNRVDFLGYMANDFWSSVHSFEFDRSFLNLILLWVASCNYTQSCYIALDYRFNFILTKN